MSKPEKDRTPWSILIVEDERILARDLARSLKSAGYKVAGMTDSAEEAIRIAEESRPNLVLMDINLAGEMDGIDAAARIRERCNIPVVFLTADSDDRIFARAKETGPLAYLTKPVFTQDLLHTVEMSLFRHYMENRLRESEEKFRQLAENIGEVFWLTEPGKPKRVVYLNPAHEKVWGITREEAYRKPGIWLRSIHNDDRQSVVEAYDAFLEEQKDYDVEYRIVRPDGSIRWVWDRAFPINDEQGRIHRVAGVSQDITKRKEDQKKQAELMDEIKRFAYIVSHDLVAPLVNVRGFCNELEAAIEVLRPLFQMSIDRLSGAERQQAQLAMESDLPESIHFIKASVSKMDHLIKAILKLSRLGRIELAPEPINVHAMVFEVLNTLSYDIKTWNIKARVGDLPNVVADRTSMEQIFINLLNNSIKYRDLKRPQEISITGYQFPEETVYLIADKGRGIEPEYKSEIFQIFKRGNLNDVPGEGMGLAYVRTLVRRHGGRIWCESQPGVGSTFTFTISRNLKKAPDYGT